jgi:hypothetical protein
VDPRPLPAQRPSLGRRALCPRRVRVAAFSQAVLSCAGTGEPRPRLPPRANGSAWSRVTPPEPVRPKTDRSLPRSASTCGPKALPACAPCHRDRCPPCLIPSGRFTRNRSAPTRRRFDLPTRHGVQAHRTYSQAVRASPGSDKPGCDTASVRRSEDRRPSTDWRPGLPVDAAIAGNPKRSGHCGAAPPGRTCLRGFEPRENSCFQPPGVTPAVGADPLLGFHLPRVFPLPVTAVPVARPPLTHFDVWVPEQPQRLCLRVSMSRKVGLSLSRLPTLSRSSSSSSSGMKVPVAADLAGGIGPPNRTCE